MSCGRSFLAPAALLFLVLILPCLLCAQAPAADAPDQAQKKKERQWGPFTMSGAIGVSSVFVDIEGSREKYRTDFNYLPGFNLSEFSFNLSASEKGTAWLDHLKLQGSGFGDAYPYQRALLLFGKRARYEFRGEFRKQDYYFSLPAFALGRHGEDSARRLSDLTLRLFPHRSLTLELGYYRNYHYGTAFTSATEFQRLFELSDPLRSLTQDFRIGATLNRGPAVISIIQNFRKFKDDPEQQSTRLLDSGGTLPELHASLPVRLSIPSTTVMARISSSERGEIEARYTYSRGHVEAGRSEFIALEIVRGVSLEEILKAITTGNRPEHRFGITGLLHLGDRILLSDAFEIDRFDISSSFVQTTTWNGLVPGPDPIVFPERAEFQMKYSVYRFRPQIEFQVDRHISLRGGYEYSERKIRRENQQENTATNLGFAGLLWRPYKDARFGLQFEKGTANDSFALTEPRDVIRWRIVSHIPVVEGLSLDPHLVFSNRRNHGTVRSYDAEQRQGGIEATYLVPGKQVVISAGYTRFNLETLADIRYFLGGQSQEDFSRYKTNLDFLHTRVSMPVGSRVAVNLGYRLLRDPRHSSYPLTRHQGEAGLSLRTFTNWIWDIQWNHTSYNEALLDSQDYTANMLALTLRWSF